MLEVLLEEARQGGSDEQMAIGESDTFERILKGEFAKKADAVRSGFPNGQFPDFKEVRELSGGAFTTSFEEDGLQPVFPEEENQATGAFSGRNLCEKAGLVSQKHGLAEIPLVRGALERWPLRRWPDPMGERPRPRKL